MEFEKWGPTTYLYWAALMVVIWVPDTPSGTVWMIAGVFALSSIWQLAQFIVIRRQRKASSAHLEAWNYKG